LTVLIHVSHMPLVRSRIEVHVDVDACGAAVSFEERTIGGGGGNGEGVVCVGNWLRLDCRHCLVRQPLELLRNGRVRERHAIV
jgi:hypothetical protein